ncbi:hypothetical protein BDN72DRAFT_964533 [Pluteus cervinus]|uniref:Uncharacterized protein n=1 Tax=Pluteus cervinus TaxID=181527 RepID=A0ACD3A9W8_9AGAR|nr:hypothetical protein BDN72DRAFT_964533 [Pluteus cervinus]
MDLSGLTNAEAISKVDREICYLETRLRTLRELRNTIPPVSSLPTEILSRIFLICHNLDVEPDTNGTVRWTPKQKAQARLFLSWVSHRWRTTAISYPDLWTFITKGNSEYTQACLIRSKGLDLAVALDAPREHHIQISLAAMPRIRSLYVHLADTPISDDIDPDHVWRQPAPHLVSLSITDMVLDYEEEHGGHPRVFSGTHPRLQHLYLDDSSFRWDIPLISVATLTTLHIIAPSITTSIHTLVEKLRVMTRLEDCKLVSCLNGPGPSSHRQPVALPSLRTLTLEHKGIALLFTLLSHLDIPNASIALKSETARPLPADFPESFWSFRDYWDRTDNWKAEELRHISITSGDMRRAFILNVSTVVPTSTMQGTSRQFTMSMTSLFGGPLDTIVQSIDLLKGNFQSAFLNGRGFSRADILSVAKFTDARILKLSDIVDGRLKELGKSGTRDQLGGQEESVEEIDLPQAFPQLEELEVDGRSYESFEEFRRLA